MTCRAIREFVHERAQAKRAEAVRRLREPEPYRAPVFWGSYENEGECEGAALSDVVRAGDTVVVGGDMRVFIGDHGWVKLEEP